MKTITLTIQATVPDDVADDPELLDLLRDAAKEKMGYMVSMRYPKNLVVSITEQSAEPQL